MNKEKENKRLIDVQYMQTKKEPEEPEGSVVRQTKKEPEEPEGSVVRQTKNVEAIDLEILALK